MERVLVIGCPGSGKSFVGKVLAERTGLPLIHLDRHHWLPGWRRPDPESWAATVDALVARPRWIMDGNYSGTLARRLAAADTVIFLDFPTRLCLWRVVRRTLRLHGRQRGEEVGEGCPERFDTGFFRYIVRYRRHYRRRDVEKLAAFDGACHRFTSPYELDRFLAQFPAPAGAGLRPLS